MENEFCISNKEVERLVKSLQLKNYSYSRETIEKAILQCCKNQKEPLNFKSFEDCVEFFTSSYHLLGKNKKDSF